MISNNVVVRGVEDMQQLYGKVSLGTLVTSAVRLRTTRLATNPHPSTT